MNGREMSRWSGGWFGIGACAAYALLLFTDHPLFRYYPLTGRFSRTTLGAGDGPQMAWYGLLAGAVLAGFATMALARLLGRGAAPGRVVLAVVAAAFALCAFVLRGFFLA